MAELQLQFRSPRYLSELYGGDDTILVEFESTFAVSLATRDDWLRINGDEAGVERVRLLFEHLERARDQGIHLRPADLRYVTQALANGEEAAINELFCEPLVLKLRRKSVVPRTINQKRYLQAMARSDVTLGLGPAGTGKTFLAMAHALHGLAVGQIERIVLTRPAVEAGEALGFLPGDLQEKLLPYLTPLYDAMHELIGRDQTAALMERNAIEIAPLAYMRGRTLTRAYMILDEAQNATDEQMMMFLTRLGEGSRMVVTGDDTQIDLPRSTPSGLSRAARLLIDIPGISVFRFSGQDIVRHPVVQRIIKAYASEQNTPEVRQRS